MDLENFRLFHEVHADREIRSSGKDSSATCWCCAKTHISLATSKCRSGRTSCRYSDLASGDCMDENGVLEPARSD